MGVLDDIATRLVNYGNIGSTTSPNPTIFIGSYPASPDQCVHLHEFRGGPGTRVMGNLVSALVADHQVQVVARAATYSTAETLAWRVHAALDGWSGTLNSNVYLFIEAQHPPYSMGQDENKRTMFVVNFLAHRRTR